MEALQGPFGVDVSSVITDYLTLDEMRVCGVPLTRDILARIVASFKQTPLTPDDYIVLLTQDYGLNVIEADILLNPPPEFLEDVGLYLKFPQHINDLIVKSLIQAYTIQTLNQLSSIISRNCSPYRQPLRSPEYHPDRGIDQTFNNTTLNRITQRYIDAGWLIPEHLFNFLIETGHDQLVQSIMMYTSVFLHVKYVFRAFGYNQDEIGDYILGTLLDEQTGTQRYDLLSNISGFTMVGLVELTNALVGNPRFMSHIDAYVLNIPPIYKNKDVFLALLNNDEILEHTSMELWLNVAGLAEGRRLKRLITKALQYM